MRVKEKSHPSNGANGSGVSSSVSPIRKQTIIPVPVFDETNTEVLDLSKRGVDKLKNGNTGSTETDAIHRRLTNSDRVGDLAHSILESIERSPPGKKRKNSPYKKETPLSPSPSKEENTVSSVSTPRLSVRETGSTPAAKLEPSNLPEESVVVDLEPDLVKREESQTNNPIDTTDVIAKANGSACPSQGNIEHNSSSAKGKKKKVVAGKKKAGKKNQKKKTFQGSGKEFEIDPRLGGSKIKDAVNKKGKEKKVKTDQQESKKPRITEQRFPYIHIEGSWNAPQVVKIVNGHLKEDEAEGKQVAKVTKAAQYVDEEHRSRAAKVGFSSTLSDRYDTHNRDVTWLCVFCKQYTHMQCLGDLYGPYYVNQVEAEPIWFSRKNPDSLNSSAGSSASSLACPSAGKKGKKSPKKKLDTKMESAACPPPNSIPTGTPNGDTIAGIDPLHPDGSEGPLTEKKEVWFHESCIVWAPGVYLVPPRLFGLDEAIADSQQTTCEYCKKAGAHIFCRTRGCGLRTHYPCAVSNSWLLKEESFFALCQVHKDQQQKMLQ